MAGQKDILWPAVTVVDPTRTDGNRRVIAIALEDCPGEEDLNILTDSLSSMRLLKDMQRQDFPLQHYSHTVRQLLLVTKLISRRAESGGATLFIKVRAHRGEPLNEGADALAVWLTRINGNNERHLSPTTTTPLHTGSACRKRPY